MPNKNQFESLRKVIAVLGCFNPQNLKLTSSEIAREIGVHRATSLRLLEFLSKAGWVERNKDNKKYGVGPALYVVGNLYLTAKDALKVAEPVVKELNELTGEVVNISIFEKGFVTLVMREESKHHIRLHYRIGSIFPAYASATGKVWLSELTDEELDSIYPHETLPPLTKKTVPTKTGLRKELEQVRKNGYSIVIEQAREGICAVGAIIRNSKGKAAAAMAIALPLIRANDANFEVLAKLVKYGADLISYQLGYRDSENQIYSTDKLRSWWHSEKNSSDQSSYGMNNTDNRQT